MIDLPDELYIGCEKMSKSAWITDAGMESICDDFAGIEFNSLPISSMGCSCKVDYRQGLTAVDHF
jgi:hypothetical protein